MKNHTNKTDLSLQGPHRVEGNAKALFLDIELPSRRLELQIFDLSPPVTYKAGEPSWDLEAFKVSFLIFSAREHGDGQLTQTGVPFHVRYKKMLLLNCRTTRNPDWVEKRTGYVTLFYECMTQYALGVWKKEDFVPQEE
jgi:hypothetical protein